MNAMKMHGPRVARIAVLLVAAALAAAHADTYQINKRLVRSERIHASPVIVKELENRWTQPISYRYERDKETCFSWSVSLSVLRTFRLGTSREGCDSRGTWTASGTLQGGYMLRVWSRNTREYETYHAQRIRVYDDGSTSVVSSTYATKREIYDTYYTSITR